jgi:hypothetical protein
MLRAAFRQRILARVKIGFAKARRSGFFARPFLKMHKVCRSGFPPRREASETHRIS